MTMRAMRTLFITLALVGFGCGDSGNKQTDAPVTPPVDAPPAVALDCPTYCTEIMTNCTGTNAQYVDQNHCLGSCAAFVVGTSKTTDTAGDTLGCRIYHGGTPSMTMPVLHCPHAGPAGEHIDLAAGTNPAFCSGATAAPDNLCQNFCALAIKTCGTTAAPVMVGTTAITPPYTDMATCVTACAGFDKTKPYLTNSGGNTLACRVNHWTNAANFLKAGDATNTQLHCNHIQATPTGPCAGTATP